MKITHEIKRVRLTKEETSALYTAMKASDTLWNNICHEESLICGDGTVISLEEIDPIADVLVKLLDGDLTIEDPKNEEEDN